MKFYHASAYSFGKESLENPTKKGLNVIPGPGQYNPILNKENLPKWKIGTEARLQNYKHDVPGPGHYSQSSSIGAGPKISIPSSKREALAKDDVNYPGPGQYSPSKHWESFAYSIPERPRALKSEVTPGPGNYNLLGGKSKQIPSYKFGREKREQMDDSINNSLPGPGKYNPTRIFKGESPPKISFGKEERGFHVDNQIPGPGEYHQKAYIGQNGPKITMSSRPRSLRPEYLTNPGPGQYSASHNRFPNSPAYIIGKSQRQSIPNIIGYNPGPGQYSPKTNNMSMRSQSPSWSVGKEKKSPINLTNINPGPGQYKPQGLIGLGPQYSFGSKTSLYNDHLVVPGPGEYDNDSFSNRFKYPSWKIGKEMRNDELKQVMKENKPGPGMYNTEDRNHVPSVKFGLEERKANYLKKTESPGPGHYRIPCSIVDVNDYTRKAGIFNPYYKYV